MKAFAYAGPSTKEQVVELLSRNNGRAAVLAGGTDLLSLIKDGAASPELLVSLKNVDGLSGIAEQDGGLRIGAMTTLEELAAEQRVGDRYPCLVQAVRGVTSPQIRNWGTVGGDLCQRPRCWYYRDGYGLLAKQNGTSMVRAGDNRYHAILGNSGDALFVNPSSLAPALIALGASLRIWGPQGERTVELADFYQIPGSDTDREYRLGPSELVLAVDLPETGGRNATYEVRQREVLDWPLATASVHLETDGDRVTNARVVLGHVAPVPWVSSEAAEAVSGKQINPETAEQAGAAAVRAAQPLSRNRYKVRLAQTAVKRALLRAAGREV